MNWCIVIFAALFCGMVAWVLTYAAYVDQMQRPKICVMALVALITSLTVGAITYRFAKNSFEATQQAAEAERLLRERTFQRYSHYIQTHFGNELELMPIWKNDTYLLATTPNGTLSAVSMAINASGDSAQMISVPVNKVRFIIESDSAAVTNPRARFIFSSYGNEETTENYQTMINWYLQRVEIRCRAEQCQMMHGETPSN